LTQLDLDSGQFNST